MKRHPVRSAAALLVALLLAVPVALAGDAQALGTWDVVANTPDGEMPSVLTISEVEGQLKAEVELGGMKRLVSNEKLAEGVFTMTVQYEGVGYDVEGKIDGDTMEGTWSGGGNSGTLKATRRP